MRTNTFTYGAITVVFLGALARASTIESELTRLIAQAVITAMLVATIFVTFRLYENAFLRRRLKTAASDRGVSECRAAWLFARLAIVPSLLFFAILFLTRAYLSGGWEKVIETLLASIPTTVSGVLVFCLIIVMGISLIGPFFLRAVPWDWIFLAAMILIGLVGWTVHLNQLWPLPWSLILASLIVIGGVSVVLRAKWLVEQIIVPDSVRKRLDPPQSFLKQWFGTHIYLWWTILPYTFRRKLALVLGLTVVVVAVGLILVFSFFTVPQTKLIGIKGSQAVAYVDMATPFVIDYYESTSSDKTQVSYHAKWKNLSDFRKWLECRNNQPKCEPFNPVFEESGVYSGEHMVLNNGRTHFFLMKSDKQAVLNGRMAELKTRHDNASFWHVRLIRRGEWFLNDFPGALRATFVVCSLFYLFLIYLWIWNRDLLFT